MKLYKLLIFILIVFIKTETLFSENNLFNVNNIQLEKKDNISNNALADEAIKKGFNQLISKILLKEDSNKLQGLDFKIIKQLVTYYQMTSAQNEEKREELVKFSITFDKDKIHDLFYRRGILYSEISNKELYILPVLLKDNEIFIFNKNFFYKNWNQFYEDDLIEFILPLENIEIIKKINEFKNNLINLDLASLFEEYKNKNLALVLIDDNENKDERIYVKTIIQNKKISKSLDLKKQKISENEFYKEIIIEVKKELINLVKSRNLIDIRTPSFLNAKLNLSKNSNLVELNLRIKNIDSIENIYVQRFNKDFVDLRIRFLGKLDKIINQLKRENIDLQLINDEWVIRTL